MTHTILEIVAFLFKHYPDATTNLTLENTGLISSLQKYGFSNDAIHSALIWLHHVEKQEHFSHTPKNTSFRVYTSIENLKIDTDCRRFILTLEKSDILTAKNREILIGHLLRLNQPYVTVADVKLVALIMLYKQPDQRAAIVRLEQMIFQTENLITQ